MSNKTTRTNTQTSTRNKVDVWSQLTAEEERVVRMRHGIGLRPDEKLELKGQEHAETRAQLARMEQQAMDAMSDLRGPAPNQRVKAHIVSRLRDDD